ncbi:unnamed protein product [Calypogeia fissa]
MSGGGGRNSKDKGGVVGKREWSATLRLTILALLLGTGAWISLLFSAKNQQCSRAAGVLSDGPPSSFDGWSDSTSFGPGETGQARESFGGMKPPKNGTGSLLTHQVVFGIAGSSQLWPKRKEIVKLWWRDRGMRGFVWLEEPVEDDEEERVGAAGGSRTLPRIMVSEDTSRFSYTHSLGHPSGIRISRLVSETFRMRLPNVKWFVMGDDDTMFNVDNLVHVLSKYDPSEMWYIGNPSESHGQNSHFSSSMAYGGGGFAISYPLAKEIAQMQDECLERYPQLFGSDDRLQACILELGVPLTKEIGFHQFDVVGNAFGILAAHPVAPFLSMHHLQLIRPLFPGMTALDGLRHLSSAMHTEPTSFLQQAICYDRKKSLSFSISLGYVVQVFPQIILPRMLQRPMRTFSAWNRVNDALQFTFDTRPAPKSICRHPLRFFMKTMDYNATADVVVGLYERQLAIDKRKRAALCWPSALSADTVTHVRVVSRPLPDRWFEVPRRQCSRLIGIQDKVLEITVGPCQPGEILPR